MNTQHQAKLKFSKRLTGQASHHHGRILRQKLERMSKGIRYPW